MQQAAGGSHEHATSENTTGGVALCLALGGSSDIIGVGALAKAAGYSRLVIVQPGSPAKGLPVPKEVRYDRIEPLPDAPGGGFYDNGSMVAYLLTAVQEAEAGYYLTQPKDDGVGFSQTSFTTTIEAIVRLAEQHAAVAILGVDFGGDASLSSRVRVGGSDGGRQPPKEGGVNPFIAERDRLNLRAAKCAAAQLGLPHVLVAVGPGVDAAGVSPDYGLRRRGVAEGKPVRVLEMGGEGELHEIPTPAPECTLPILPDALFQVIPPTPPVGRAARGWTPIAYPTSRHLPHTPPPAHPASRGVSLRSLAPLAIPHRILDRTRLQARLVELKADRFLSLPLLTGGCRQLPIVTQARLVELEADFLGALRPLAARILNDCPAEKRKVPPP